MAETKHEGWTGDQHEGRLEDHLPVGEELNFDTRETNSRRAAALDQGPMAKLNRENDVALQCNDRLAERF